MGESDDLQGFFDSMLAPEDASPEGANESAGEPIPAEEEAATAPAPGDEASSEMEAAMAPSTTAEPAQVDEAETEVPAAVEAPEPVGITEQQVQSMNEQIAAERMPARAETPTPLGGIPVQVPAPAPEEPNPDAVPPREWVIFSLEDQTYALDVHLVREIVRPPHLEPMPHAPETLVGMANLRGIVVPVFDIAKLLGWAPAERDGLARVIVIEHDDDMLGLLVDSVQEILRFDGASVEPPPAVGASTQHVVALLRQPERLVQLLDPNTLFSQ